MRHRRSKVLADFMLALTLMVVVFWVVSGQCPDIGLMGSPSEPSPTRTLDEAYARRTPGWDGSMVSSEDWRLRGEWSASGDMAQRCCESWRVWARSMVGQAYFYAYDSETGQGISRATRCAEDRVYWRTEGPTFSLPRRAAGGEEVPLREARPSGVRDTDPE